MPKVDRWCPECGFDIVLDSDGRCGHCGNQATGPGVEKIDLMAEILQGLLRRSTWEAGNGELRSLGSGTLAIAIRFWASLGFAKIIEDNGGLLVVAQETPMGAPIITRGTRAAPQKDTTLLPPPAAKRRTRGKKTD